ncbi:MAG: EFR1 family ferrodoxin [Endomicrobium sp.]|nr:EFR1 family ferrodoxin [Endomicrobium sp.]
MKIIDIYYFTGTGNTYLAAKKIEATLKHNDYTVNINDITKTDPHKINLLNTIGIGFPVVCWNTFPIVKEFIYNLPQTFDTKIFIFTTMGNYSLKAAANFGNILKNKGYSLIGTDEFLMPNNFIAVQKEDENITKREKTYKKIEIFTNKLIKGTLKTDKINFFFKFCFVISNFITNKWKWKLFQKIIKFNIIKNKCAKCHLCIKICPVKNITLKNNNYPIFSSQKCQLCLRCISYCPSHAIKSFLIKKTYRALNKEEMQQWLF